MLLPPVWRSVQQLTLSRTRCSPPATQSKARRDAWRRALVAAPGRPGAPPVAEAAVPDARSVPDTAAYLLAVTLADAGGRTATLLSTAAVQCERGRSLTAVG